MEVRTLGSFRKERPSGLNCIAHGKCCVPAARETKGDRIRAFVVEQAAEGVRRPTATRGFRSRSRTCRRDEPRKGGLYDHFSSEGRARARRLRPSRGANPGRTWRARRTRPGPSAVSERWQRPTTDTLFTARSRGGRGDRADRVPAASERARPGPRNRSRTGGARPGRVPRIAATPVRRLGARCDAAR